MGPVVICGTGKGYFEPSPFMMFKTLPDLFKTYSRLFKVLHDLFKTHQDSLKLEPPCLTLTDFVKMLSKNQFYSELDVKQVLIDLVFKDFENDAFWKGGGC